MEIIASARAVFDAGHTVSGLPRCSSSNHGHSWTVTVELTDELDAKSGVARGSETLLDSLEGLVRELRLRNLDEMLPGTVTSPAGIAAVVLDRLALRHPRITSVSVDCSDGTGGTIRRTPRQL